MLIEAYEGFEWVMWSVSITNVMAAYTSKTDANLTGPYICLAMSYFLVILTITDTLKG